MTKEEIAGYAYENVPFYQKIVEELPQSWEEYPVVDKKMILENIDSCLAPEYMMDYLTGGLEKVLTSGSTGDCLEIWWKKDQQVTSLLPLWVKRKQYYGISPRDRRCYFFTTKIVNGEELQFEETRYGLGFGKMDLSEEKVLFMYEQMLAFRPKWMIVQPSMIQLLMGVVEKHGLQKLTELTYVELTGERVSKETKTRIKEFFGCNVASQYGCYEVNSIAYECPCGNMHVMGENVYAEIVGEDEICVTSLQNKVMPFIRYKIGDRGKMIGGHNCSCGCKEPIIELSMARENDWIYNKDGTVSHSDMFCHAIDCINLTLEQAVSQYQIIQVDYDEFEVHLVVQEKRERPMVQELFLKHIGNYQRERKFEFFFVDSLYPSEKTGKLAWFVTTLTEKQCENAPGFIERKQK